MVRHNHGGIFDQKQLLASCPRDDFQGERAHFFASASDDKNPNYATADGERKPEVKQTDSDSCGEWLLQWR